MKPKQRTLRVFTSAFAASFKFLILCPLALAATSSSLFAQSVIREPIPAYPTALQKEWEADMKKFGRQHCNYIKSIQNSPNAWEQLDYDGAWVFYQIGDYTKDSYWYDCARVANTIYRNWVISNSGNVAAHWNFGDGLTRACVTDKDSKSCDALRLLSSAQGTYCGDQRPLSVTESSAFSRPVAYCVNTQYLLRTKLGTPKSQKFDGMAAQLYWHLRQWFDPNEVKVLACPTEGVGEGERFYFRPFMAALTLDSLRNVYLLTKNPEILDGFLWSLDRLWNSQKLGVPSITSSTPEPLPLKRMWEPTRKAFFYSDRQVNEPLLDEQVVPDLNLMLAHHYAWAYQMTGDADNVTRAISLLQGARSQQKNSSYLHIRKNFFQNYRRSFLLFQLLPRTAIPLKRNVASSTLTPYPRNVQVRTNSNCQNEPRSPRLVPNDGRDHVQ
jgi:hypothetical protein